MNFKKTIILAAVLCFLLIVFYLIESPKKDAKKPEHPLFLSGFDRAQAAAVFLESKAKGKISLRKKADGWSVEVNKKTYAADAATVDNLLNTAAKIRIESIVSRSPGKYPAFEVDAENGVDVRIEDTTAQKSLAHFVVGKSGPDLFSTYLRLADAQQVVLASGMLKMAFERELKDWRNKTIFSLNQQEITGYQVAGDLQYQLQKSANGAWEMIAPEKFAPKKELVEDCLKTIAALNAADFAEGRLQDFQLDKPAREITVTLKSGPARTLLIGKEKNAFQRFVKKADADTVYVLESYNLEKLSPPLAVLKLGEAAKDLQKKPASDQQQAQELKKEAAPQKKASKPARTASGKKKKRRK